MTKQRIDITLRNGIILKDVPIAKMTVHRDTSEKSIDSEIMIGNRKILERIEKMVNRMMD